MFKRFYLTLKKHQFLFEELVKRDFQERYQRTVLGMGWSILSPLLTMLVLYVVFVNLFGRRIIHYAVYILCGNIIFSYYREATRGGMNALLRNAAIITKINVPKYLFLLSKNVSALINFGLTLGILLVFVICDHITITWKFLCLIYPILCLIAFNIGVGLVLSAWFVFYRDTAYLYDVFTMLLMYASAIFYQIAIVPLSYRFIFYFNPIWVYINYFRQIILFNRIPTLQYHGLCLLYPILVVALGGWIYHKYNHKFLYYL